MQDQLQAVLSAKMVEPNRISISLGQNAAEQAPKQDSPGAAKRGVELCLTTAEQPPHVDLPAPERPSWMPWRGRASRVTAVQTLATQQWSAVTAVSEAVAAQAQHETADTLICALEEEDSGQLEAAGDQGVVKPRQQPFDYEQASNAPENGMKESMQHAVHVIATCTVAAADAAQQGSRAADIHSTMGGCIRSDSRALLNDGAILPGTSDIDPQEAATSPHTVHGSASSADAAADAGEDSTPAGPAASQPAPDGDFHAEKEARVAACRALAHASANLEALRRRMQCMYVVIHKIIIMLIFIIFTY